jgi:hypothetical protein
MYGLLFIRWVLDLNIVFIDILYIKTITTINYSPIVDSTRYTSSIHTLVSSVFTSYIQATDL